MRFLSLFSGIEAASVAWKPLGWECVAVSEIEPFPCAVLAHHFPDVPNLGDVTKITETDIAALGQIDLVVFGSPCQDLSVAGKRAGFSGARSGLFLTAIDIVRWARKHGGCRFALWENVPGAFSSNQGRDFAAVVGEMAGLRDVAVPANGWGAEGVALGDDGLLEWGVLDAQYFGVAQRRRRVFALADFGNWQDREPILLERQSLRRDSPPSREPGQNPAAGTLRSSDGGSDVDHACAGHLVAVGSLAFGGNNQSGPIDVATARNACASPSGQLDFETETFVVQPQAMSFQPGNLIRGAGAAPSTEVFPTLKSDHGRGRSDQDLHVLAPIAFDSRQDPVSSHHVFGALGSSGPQAQAVAHRYVMPTMVSGGSTDASHNQMSGQFREEYIVPQGVAVRRLTPVEAERLQGFPDGYTFVPSWNGWRKMDASETPESCRAEGLEVRQNAKTGKWRVKDVDGPRYKALGNSMAVPVMRWIGRRIQAAKKEAA